MKLSRSITVHCALGVCLYFVFVWIVLLLSIIHQDRTLITTLHKLAASPAFVNKRAREAYHKKTLLREDDKVSKVIILTYVRSGSSIFSELFDVGHSTSVRWYEPLDSFFAAHFGLNLYSLALPLLYHNNLNRRTPSKRERAELIQFLKSLLSCDFDRLPIETLTHSEFLKKTTSFHPQLKKCLPDPASSLYHCTQILREICGGGFDDTRRNLTVAIRNKCPEIIRNMREIEISNTTKTATNSEVRMSFSHNQHSVEKRGKPLLETQISETENVQNIKQFAVNEIHPSILDDSITDTKQLALDKSIQVSIFDKRQRDYLPYFLKHSRCLERLETPVRKCMKPKIERKCKRATVVTAKLVRATMSDISPLIGDISSNIKVLYFVRDPRAIATSRAQNSSRLTYFADDTSVTTEARMLCVRMKDDISSRNSLLKMYHESILTIRYEDFILTPKETIDRVFKYIGRARPINIDAWIRKTMKGRGDNGPFGTTRANSTASVDRWKTIASNNEITIMNRYCGSVLHLLGYNI